MISPQKDPQVLGNQSHQDAENRIMYVEEGQSYDEDEYETDSDDGDSNYSRSESEGDEIGNESEEIEDEEVNERQSKSEKGTDTVENGDRNDGNNGSCVAANNVAGNNIDDVDINNKLKAATQYIRKMNDMGNGTSSGMKDTVNENNSKDNAISEADMRSNESVILNRTGDLLSEPRTDLENTEASAKVQTMAEKRSLLALAAEHDRVDIIKTILQSSHPDAAATSDSTALIQLMLNNRIDEYSEDSTCLCTEDDLEKVFLPPLHLAIASSSTNAACCFLRMGADPSLRPSIPLNWSGPDYRKAENVEPGLVMSDWRLFHDLSAWELAFGTIYTVGAVTVEAGKVNEKEGWFHWSSKNTAKDCDNVDAKNSPINIAPSKLEGIRHAFMAEALRAIGADEVKRLSELISSGIDSASRGSIKSSLNNERIEVGGKDLLGWCITMNAEKCSSMLKTMYENSSDVQEHANDAVSPHDKKIESIVTEAPEDKDDEKECSLSPSATRLCDLQTQLEEIQSLAIALSSILDDIAEEVSSLQALIFENGQSSNSALLSQIRTLKEARVQKEDELEAAESRVGDLENELRMVLMWWTNQGGTEDEIFSARLGNMVSAKRSNNEVLELNGRRSKESKLLEQKALCENNIQKIRTKISDLAEEKSRSIILVEKMGLAGAIKLTRTIREETLEMKYSLENAKSLETEYCAKIRLIRDRLEKRNHELCSPQETQVMEATEDIASGGVNVQHEQHNDRESSQYTSMNESTQSIGLQGDEGTELREVALNEENAEVPNQRDKAIAPSEAISKGASDAIAPRVEGYQSHLSINIWNLILRIVSLGRVSFKKAVSTTSNETFSNVMIV